jgi:CoA:oxalate CoA-transferase
MSLPLDGVVVIDLSQIYNGPYATFLLATSGATVIKVEPPGGESLRRRGSVGGAALPFALLNGCKRSIVLNLKTDEGKDLLRDLVRAGDVLVENFAPGVLDRLGVGAAALQDINPRLIYAQSSGYGTSGPYRDYPAMDLTVQAMSGVMSITGFQDRPPVKAGPALCDFFAGVHLYGAVATALYERERTGVGRRVEVAMLDAVYPSLGSSLGLHFDTQGDVPPRTGNRHAGLAEAPYNVYPTSDGYIAILCVSETHWKSLLRVMDRGDLASDPALRITGGPGEKYRPRGRNDLRVDANSLQAGLVRSVDDQPVPCAPVRNLTEVVNDPHLHARGMLQWQDHPELGRIIVQHSPLRFAGDPQRTLEPSHALGADTERVLEDRLGLRPEQISDLAERGVI